MSCRKEYLGWFDSDGICFIPADFPDHTMVNGGEFYDYNKVNRWFAENKRLLLCRWGHCCDCEDFTPEIKEQQCQHNPDTWDIKTCHTSHSSNTKANKDE